MIYRHGKYPLKLVLDVIKRRNEEFIFIDGIKVRPSSQRYKLFKRDGFHCCKCGLKASFCALESNEDNLNIGHLNVYGILNGEEILFTKDHIVPKSKGGTNKMDNYQVMCVVCNNEKGNKI